MFLAEAEYRQRTLSCNTTELEVFEVSAVLLTFFDHTKQLVVPSKIIVVVAFPA